MKIIVVDDEPLVKQYIVQCVRDAGGENEITAAVTSGAKVLQEMKANPADVVFADITMPKMDGIELLQELQRQYRKREAFERQIVKIISGGSQSGDVDDGFYNDGEMMWPVPYKNSYISAGYGYYDPEGDGTYTMHPAIDIVVRENGVNVSYGKKIVAAQSGKVLVRGYSDVGGNYITIDHGDGYRTYYGHCSKIVASAGQYVEKGEVIAYMGNTGYVTGPHVHFQVMHVKNGAVTRLNPLDFVTPPN